MSLVQEIKNALEGYASDYTKFDDASAYNWAIQALMFEKASIEEMRAEYMFLMKQAIENYQISFKKGSKFKVVESAGDFNEAVWNYLEDISNKTVAAYGFTAETRTYSKNNACLYSGANWFVAAFIIVLDARKQPQWMRA